MVNFHLNFDDNALFPTVAIVKAPTCRQLQVLVYLLQLLKHQPEVATFLPAQTELTMHFRPLPVLQTLTLTLTLDLQAPKLEGDPAVELRELPLSYFLEDDLLKVFLSLQLASSLNIFPTSTLSRDTVPFLSQFKGELFFGPFREMKVTFDCTLRFPPSSKLKVHFLVELVEELAEEVELEELLEVVLALGEGDFIN